MTQPALGAVRDAVAAYLTASVPGLNASKNFAQINVPMAVVLPTTGTFLRYSVTFEGETNYSLRTVMLVSQGDSLSGQDLLDAYLAVSGTSSVYAAVQKDPTLGGQVSYAAVIEATAYGLMNFGSVDYLAASLIWNIGT